VAVDVRRSGPRERTALPNCDQVVEGHPEPAAGGHYPAAVLVDVMVPAYGDGAHLRETVASVLAQGDPSWRLTVVDDGVAVGRDPGLGPWLAGLGDERVRYLANPVRLGINRNFQRCAELSTAELVVILGADDRLLPDFVDRVRRLAEQYPAAAFLHTGARIVDEAGHPTTPLVDRVKARTSIRVRDSAEVGGERLAASLLHGNWMYFPSVVFRRAALVEHGFRPGYDIVLDLDLYLRILRGGGSAVLCERPGIEYRRHSASLSSARADDGSRFIEERAFFTEAAAELAAHGWPRAARAARWHLTSRLHVLCKLPGLLAAGNLGGARTMLRGALSTVSAGLPDGAGPGEGVHTR
jgi:GT2 family glycosyltransferase